MAMRYLLAMLSVMVTQLSEAQKMSRMTIGALEPIKIGMIAVCWLQIGCHASDGEFGHDDAANHADNAEKGLRISKWDKEHRVVHPCDVNGCRQLVKGVAEDGLDLAGDVVVNTNCLQFNFGL